MRILIENYSYDTPNVYDVIGNIGAISFEGKTSIPYVGYYYNSRLKDCVFILPKVLFKDGTELVFGKYCPEDIINLDDRILSAEERHFIIQFSVWIYRAIVVYKSDKRNDTSIILQSEIHQAGKGQQRFSNAYLDILISCSRLLSLTRRIRVSLCSSLRISTLD